jgi:hypothetical protein
LEPESSIVFTVRSGFGREIRLTQTIWRDKILLEHPEFRQDQRYLDEIRKVVGDPQYIVKGWSGEYLALRICDIAPKSPKYLCVVYRELNGDGFIITAFFVSEYQRLLRRGVLWSRK